MTCQETRKLVCSSLGKGGVLFLSRGERIAIWNHLGKCAECDKWLADCADLANKISGLTPEQIAEADARIDAKFRPIVERDLQDPESV